MNKKQIVNYWDKRAESFSKDKQAELESSHAKAWLKEIEAIIPLRDGNYGKDSFINYGDISTDHAHNTLGDEMLQESEAIKQSIPINHQSRPQYDMNILKQLGYKAIHLDTGVYNRIYKEQDAFYNPTPIFLISVTKPMT